MESFAFPILSIMLLLPVAGAIICLLVRDKAARNIALLVSFAMMALGIFLWINFEASGAQWQFVERVPLAATLSWSLGIDGIALLLIVLTVFLIPVCIAASWRAITVRVKEYMALFLLMETLIIGVFAAQDIFLFYIMFEAGLIPMYLIIGIWGGDNRIYASYKFFLYTLLGSVLMLIAILWMVADAGTADIPSLLAHNFAPEAQPFLWFAFLASFAVKMPMWPVHTWLPDAHVQAPTAGSVLLAGILLKLGGYGFIRFSIPMFPQASVDYAWLIFVLSCIAVIYTSLVALVQHDMKKLIAYSSVAHMGIVTIGLFTFNQQGLEGAIIVMLSHGLVSGALFLCVGVIYDRLHTREIDQYGGLANNMPRYALFFMLFTMASIGLPGTSGFVGEFLSLVGAYRVSTSVAFIAAIGVILGAAYMLYLYWRVIFGTAASEKTLAMPDLGRREMMVLAPIAVLVLWMGIYPETFFAPIRDDVSRITQRISGIEAHTEVVHNITSASELVSIPVSGHTEYILMQAVDAEETGPLAVVNQNKGAY